MKCSLFRVANTQRWSELNHLPFVNVNSEAKLKIIHQSPREKVPSHRGATVPSFYWQTLSVLVCSKCMTLRICCLWGMNHEAPVNNCVSQASQWFGTSNHVLSVVRLPHLGLSTALQGSISDLGTWGTFQMGQGPYHISYFSWGLGIVQCTMFSLEKPWLALVEWYKLNLTLMWWGYT